MKSVSKKQEAITKQQLRTFEKHRQAELQMLTGKKMGLQERLLIKLENIEHHPLNAL